jgi:16S rRNA (adenine1518-N6/adenine1519-N6)-dimethyltransferase
MLPETLKILKNNGIKLDKKKGQNYLVNTDVLSRIIQSSELSKNDTVLEIGAGIGTLTIPLAKEAKKVFAVEKDEKIAAILIRRLKELKISNVNVLVGDATKIDLPDANKVVSNLPYKISSPITFKLLEKPFEMAILMYQWEFAERMIASHGDPNYSRLSVMMYFYADVEMLFKVSKNDFFPKPKVSSAVIKMIPKNKLEVDDFFIKVARALFQHKKKKIRNALMDSFHEIGTFDKSERKSLISQLDQEIVDQRVFKISPEDILALSNEIKRKIYNN